MSSAGERSKSRRGAVGSLSLKEAVVLEERGVGGWREMVKENSWDGEEFKEGGGGDEGCDSGGGGVSGAEAGGL
ncbi:hypothetical protein IEQ34_018263 [Dendrobium chrysotoxum]|uniref:Uncharacterized protein n=1 Tax=Dendrobium chrysotoxum TaxID=161865 RepID=A0AAV7GDG1_DENCH|nr:hypothetical protein IEQ34_018263 [Dendrobium chrysotoxum]